MNKIVKVFNRKNKNGVISVGSNPHSISQKLILNKTFLYENFGENLSSEIQIDLSNKQIDEIDEDTFNDLPNLEYINLNGNRIQEIDQANFNALPNLKELHIDDNKIRFIDKDLFKDLNNLISLSINNNRIEYMPQNLFSNLKNLCDLDLSNNRIDRICREYFEDLINLKFIRLNNNHIKQIEKGSFSGLQNLTGLYLKNNLLREIHKDVFEGLTNLKVIDWSSNKIKNVEKETFVGLLNLAEIILDDNFLESIDKNTFHGVNLKLISLKNNKIKFIDKDSFTAHSNLQKIILRDNLMQSLDTDIFKDLSDIELINLSNNQLQKINKNIFNGLKKLKKVGLSSNQMESIDKDLFKELVSLEFIYMNNNNLKKLDKETFSGLLNLIKIVLSNNQLQSIHENTFRGLKSLREISLNNNQIKKVYETTFNGLFNLQKINLSFNQLTEMDKSIFIGLDSLEEISFNDNQLTSLPNGIFRDNKALSEINLSNNDISKILIGDLMNLNEETTINLRNNIEIYDFSLIFNSLFQFIKNDKNQKTQSCFHENYHKNTNKSFFLVRQFNFENFLLSFYLNEGVFKTKFLFDENQDSFTYNLDQIKSYKFTLLDFILSYRMIDESFIINFKGYIENLLKENKLAHNIEFKLKSPHTIEIICERNDLLLFETFFENEMKIYDENSKNQWILDNKEYYLSINFVKCFTIILNNNNEKLAILLFNLLSYVIKKFDVPKFGIQRFSKYSYFKLEEYKNIIDFNEKFLKEFLAKIFEIRWFNLIKTILDLAYNSTEKRLESRFIYLSENFLDKKIINKSIQLNSTFNKRNLKEHSRNKRFNAIQVIVDTPIVGPAQSSKKSNATFERLSTSGFLKPSNPREFKISKNDEESITALRDKLEISEKIPINEIENKRDEIQNNILFLINDSKNSTFLVHETTQELLNQEWSYVPRVVYHFNLILYILFLIFYTIQALGYIGNYYGLAFNSIIICSILLSYFIFLKFLDLWDLNFKFFTSFKNITELLNFILCFIVLYLPDTDYKSCILSLTGVLSYAIFISRLDKLYGIGIFVKVFGKIIKTSIGVIIIIIIMLIGYALSITVRSRYYVYLKNTNQTNGTINEITNFENSFENNIYTMMIYMCGQLVSNGIGVDELNASSLVMFVIYGTFMFCMTILFYNIFVGIATYEIKEILQNSIIEIASTKIDYIYQFEYRFRDSKMNKWFDKTLKLVEFFFKLRYLFNFFSSNIKIKKNHQKQEKSDEEKEKEMIAKINETSERLLIELKQITYLMQNKFDFIDQRMDKMEKIIKIKISN